MKFNEVFTPNDTPKVTYVERADDHEGRLRILYEMPKQVVSISGPSKSGKTVLIRRVVPEDYLIPIVGAGISNPNDLWDRALQWMGLPTEKELSRSTEKKIALEGKAGGEAGIPFVTKGSAEASLATENVKSAEVSETYSSSGIVRIIKEISDSEFVIFIDDFHYIRPEFREEIGRQIKVAAENGVKVFTASVPHRTDDVVRSNPELRGRVGAVDIRYWAKEELAGILNKGLDALNASVQPDLADRLSLEAFGSPQLMQSICFNLCAVIGLFETRHKHEYFKVTDDQISETLRLTSSFTDFSKMVQTLQTGPRTRGTERKLHELTDGSKGDVYRAVLLALKQEPAALAFTYENIQDRVRSVSQGDAPVGSSINSCLEQMNILAELTQPNSSPLAWDGDTLDIVDPYFLFFLRCSDKLREIAPQ